MADIIIRNATLMETEPPFRITEKKTLLRKAFSAVWKDPKLWDTIHPENLYRATITLRKKNGAVIDNAYTGQVLEEVINVGTTIRKIATSGPYKGIRVIVTPIELDNRIIAAIGVVDIRTMAGINNLIRLRSDDND